MPKPITNANDPQLPKAYLAALAQYGDQPDVCGVDIGYRYAGTRMLPNDGLVVRVHRSPKLSESDEGARARRPMAKASAAAAVPAIVEGVPLVVLHAKYARHQGASGGTAAPDIHKRLAHADPLCPGVQVAQRNGTGGTLGLIVFDLDLEAFSILSNQHVLRVDGASPEIDQPELARGGTEVATFTRAIANPIGDAALARLDKKLTLSAVQFGTKVVVAAAANVRIGDVVRKSGAGSGLTTGVVDGIGCYRMDDNEKPMDGFRIVAKPRNRDISTNGDSGAVWFRKSDHKGLGLHVGGDITVANLERRPAIAAHLPAVLQALNADIRPIP
jgi:hypothetical protein